MNDALAIEVHPKQEPLTARMHLASDEEVRNYVRTCPKPPGSIIGFHCWSIYVLADPRDYTIGYVGTSHKAGYRYQQHLSLKEKNAAKNAWIQSLLDAGITPSIHQVELVTGDSMEAEYREYEWITMFLRLGMPLTNRSGVTAPHLRRKKTITNSANERGDHNPLSQQSIQQIDDALKAAFNLITQNVYSSDHLRVLECIINAHNALARETGQPSNHAQFMEILARYDITEFCERKAAESI